MSDRVLHLEGVHNFRDCGGYVVQGGGRVRRGRLWRSGEHYGATDSDLEKIAVLGLSSVFDLRASREREAHPCRRPSAFAADIFHSQDPQWTHAPHIAAAQTTRQRTAESMRESLKRNYAGICFRPELQAMMRHYLDHLAKGGGPALINCLAGKDRTGIAVAMLHFALGMHRDDVMEDYLLTNTAGDPEARIAAGARAARAILGTLDDDVLRVLMGVEPEYLETALSAVDQQYGTIDAYLAEALGADAALRRQLCEALVEA